jgi:putative Mg2+ transporter-C (MgtC) family protein
MPHLLEIALNIAAAWVAGTLIGLERSYNGRPAGFRTHALVSLAAAATAIISFEPMFFVGLSSSGAERLDPSRLAQGVMTGIGFLGAGVIFKEGLSVQGLTTAASIWACAAVGFLFGVGMHVPAALVTGAVLITLGVFRLVDDWAPWRIYSYAALRFAADSAPREADLVELLGEPGVVLRDMSYRLLEGGKVFEYGVNLEGARQGALSRLAERLRKMPGLIEFELSRVSN